MLRVEIRFLVQGKEVSVDSFVETIVREVRASVREEISRSFPSIGRALTMLVELNPRCRVKQSLSARRRVC